MVGPSSNSTSRAGNETWTGRVLAADPASCFDCKGDWNDGRDSFSRDAIPATGRIQSVTPKDRPVDPIYEPHESPPLPFALGIAFQNALLGIPSRALFPLIIAQAAGMDAAYTAWLIFGAFIFGAVTTALQALRIGPVGTGTILISAPSVVALPFCILALQNGGPLTLGALVFASGIAQILISRRFAVLRQVITPSFSGIVSMLIAITIVAIAGRNLSEMPAGTSPGVAMACSTVALAIILAVYLHGNTTWRAWAPVFGIAAGGVVGGFFGIYDFGAVAQAPWFSLPAGGWPGLQLDFGLPFWTLLPAFLFVGAIGMFQTSSVALSAQRASSRDRRAIDYRRIQSSILGIGIGNILAGIASVNFLTIGALGTRLILQTSCASRNVAFFLAAMFGLIAFFPKLWSLVTAMPGPVIAAYLLASAALLLADGAKSAFPDGVDFRKSVIAGSSLAIGLMLHFRAFVLPIPGPWGPILQQGMISGGIVMAALMFLAEAPTRQRRLKTELSISSLPAIVEFLDRLSSSQGWGDEMTMRLRAVAEETIYVLSSQFEPGSDPVDVAAVGAVEGDGRPLLLRAKSDGAAAELEFISTPTETENVEDLISLLTNPSATLSEPSIERDVSLRLLRHYASSVTHKQFHETEVITVRVEREATD